MSTPAPSARVRSFVAIELADPARTAVAEYLEALRSEGGVAWTPLANLHLTLKFLGDVVPARLDALAARLAAIASAQPPFELTVAGVGAFPNLARPRVLWIGVDAAELSALAGEVEQACAAEGRPAESRPFRPHLTLGRIRDAAPGRGRRDRGGGRGARRGAPDSATVVAALGRDGGRRFGSSRADEMVLFQSELLPSGARHTALARLPFGASPARA